MTAPTPAGDPVGHAVEDLLMGIRAALAAEVRGQHRDQMIRRLCSAASALAAVRVELDLPEVSRDHLAEIRRIAKGEA